MTQKEKNQHLAIKKFVNDIKANNIPDSVKFIYNRIRIKMIAENRNVFSVEKLNSDLTDKEKNYLVEVYQNQTKQQLTIFN